MIFAHRPMQPEDVPECVKIMAAHPVFGPRYGREIETLPEAWRVGTLDSSEIRHALRKRLGEFVSIETEGIGRSHGDRQEDLSCHPARCVPR